MASIQNDVAAFAQVVAGLRSQGRRVVLVPGIFDLLHAGHVRMLKDARSRGDYLVVALQSDGAARRTTGNAKRPLLSAADRAEVLSSLSFVHYVTFFDGDDASELVLALRPAAVVRGRDVSEKDFPEKAAAAEVGAVVALGGSGKITSTTQLVGGSAGAKKPAASKRGHLKPAPRKAMKKAPPARRAARTR